MTEAIVDIQGFKKGINEFVLKEFAVTATPPFNIGEIKQQCVFFDPPFDEDELSFEYQRMSDWLTENYHGIPWESLGDHKYADVALALGVILAGITRVWVKGAEKKKWLRNLIDKPNLVIENLEDLGCPKMEDLEGWNYCPKHHRYSEKDKEKRFVCALRNVTGMKLWYSRYLKGCVEKSLKTFCEVRDLSLMDFEEIQYLPKYFLLEFANDQINDAWDMLPLTMQKDPDILGYRRCNEHRRTARGDQIDGPLPFIKDCVLCQLFHQ